MSRRAKELARRIVAAAESAQASALDEALSTAVEAGDGVAAEAAISWSEWETGLQDALVASLEDEVDETVEREGE